MDRRFAGFRHVPILPRHPGSSHASPSLPDPRFQHLDPLRVFGQGVRWTVYKGLASRAAEDHGLSAESRGLYIWSTTVRCMSQPGIGLAECSQRSSAIHPRSSVAASACGRTCPRMCPSFTSHVSLLTPSPPSLSTPRRSLTLPAPTDETRTAKNRPRPRRNDGVSSVNVAINEPCDTEHLCSHASCPRVINVRCRIGAGVAKLVNAATSQVVG